MDNHLLPITLPSVFKLRTFINTTLADILFYASPIYCQVEKNQFQFQSISILRRELLHDV